MAPSKQDFLIILTNWQPPAEWISDLRRKVPNIHVESYIASRSTDEPPKDIPEETWKKATALLTWKWFPKKELVPNLEYVQLISAGSNHVIDLPLFQHSDIALCTANGVHPYALPPPSLKCISANCTTNEGHKSRNGYLRHSSHFSITVSFVLSVV